MIGAALVFIFFSLSMTVEGSDLSNFMSKYKGDVEKFIMSGYGGGWEMCDLIVTSPFESNPSTDIPNIMGDINLLKTLDIWNILAKSHCLLLLAQAEDNATLTSIIEFGWTAIQHKRVGMMLSLGSNMSLDKGINTTNMPFLIAAQLGRGEEQFLCPTVGNQQAQLQSSMCDQNLALYKGKTIRVGLSTAFIPYGFKTEKGVPDGVDRRFLEVLQDKMDFDVEVVGLSWLASQGFKLVLS